MDIQTPEFPERLHPFYVKSFDKVMNTEPGELEFYRRIARDAAIRNERVLDIGCGTGRISIEMANAGAEVLGMDLSPSILTAAREKTKGRKDIYFVQGDLVEFDLGQQFGVVVMTGHSFHYATTTQAQRSCLASIAKHLQPNGLLTLDLNRVSPTWTAELLAARGDWTEVSEPFMDPDSGHEVRMIWNCRYEQKTETLFSTLSWEFRGEDGKLIEHRKADPIVTHYYYRFEVEHLLERSGFSPEHLYGDFFEGDYTGDNETMLWVARLRNT